MTAEARDESDNSLLATYRWTADGAKAGVRDGNGTSGFEYVGSLIYSRNGNRLELESTGFGGGRFQVTDTGNDQSCTPNYFLTDHLGSTRVVLNSQGMGQERNDYYAFGGRWEVGSTSANRFRFSGKEDQTTGDLPFQDFGARFLNKRLPVFTGPDPLAEVRPWESPYIYCGSNPVNRTDPTGMLWGADDEEDKENRRRRDEGIADSKRHMADVHAQSDTWAMGDGSSGFSGLGSKIRKTFSVTIELGNLEGSIAEQQEKMEAIGQLTDCVEVMILGQTMLIPMGSIGDIIYQKQVNGSGAALKEVPWVALEAMGVGGFLKSSAKASKFFKAGKYGDKVINQMAKSTDAYHNFPSAVDKLASQFGNYYTKLGGDGKIYKYVDLPGKVNGNSGVYRYIMDGSGEITHRFFHPIR